MTLLKIASIPVAPKRFLIAYHLWSPYCHRTYHLIPRKVNVPNLIRSKIWKTRIDTNATWRKWLWESIMAIFRNQQGKIRYTKIQEFINRTRQVKIIDVNTFFCEEKQNVGLFVYHLKAFAYHCWYAYHSLGTTARSLFHVRSYSDTTYLTLKFAV